MSLERLMEACDELYGEPSQRWAVRLAEDLGLPSHRRPRLWLTGRAEAPEGALERLELLRAARRAIATWDAQRRGLPVPMVAGDHLDKIANIFVDAISCGIYGTNV